MKKNLLYVPVLFCLSCTAQSDLQQNESLLIDEALLDVKRKLPKKNSPYTIWTDIYRDGKTIYFTYKMDGYHFPEEKIPLLEKVASSEPIKSQMCNFLNDEMEPSYSIVSNTFDMNQKLIFSYSYNEKNCAFKN
ncbi:hypothetical protein [Acinetobacter tianfuensis]|uniref:Uncharacterized protein n=1 Tax=Acinetobacter tianfuensis TaxID=2419603 RepID=A0A3A8E9B6_9GAMM|nr:hypothetical protein [Acinetobacter tianfuensis]RKG31427.1 hypothetical protein D7V32_08155 [Acinetobacter tianfuensis]